MATYAQVPVRLEARLVSNPPVPLIDQNTGETPKFWRAQSVAIQVGIFDSSGVAVNLSNLSYLAVDFMATPDALLPLVTKTVEQGDIIPYISAGAWADGDAQQATFTFTNAELDFSLDGENEKQIWMAFRGVTLTGEQLVYSAGYVSFYNPGNLLPLRPFGYVSRHAQTNSEGNGTIAPTSLDHTEFLTVNGEARTSYVILSTTGLSDGAQLRIRLNLTATPDVVLVFVNALVSGTELSRVTTGSVLNAALDYVYDADAGSWVPTFYALPAT